MRLSILAATTIGFCSLASLARADDAPQTNEDLYKTSAFLVQALTVCKDKADYLLFPADYDRIISRATPPVTTMGKMISDDNRKAIDADIAATLKSSAEGDEQQFLGVCVNAIKQGVSTFLK